MTTSTVLGEFVERYVQRVRNPHEAGFDKFVGVDNIDSDELHLRRHGVLGVDPLPPTFRFVFREGMVLFPTRRPALRKCAVAPFDGITGEKVLVLKTRSPKRLLPEFLPYLLASDEVKSWVTEKAIGSVTPHFRWTDLAEYPCAMPSASTQRKAVQALVAVDASREALLSAETQATMARKALLEYYCGGAQVTIPLAEALVQVLSGTTPSRGNTRFWGGTIPWLSPKDMKVPLISDTLEHLAEEALQAGASELVEDAVFVVVRGMILAHTLPVCRASRPVAFNQDIKALVFRSDIEPQFAQAWLEWSAPRCLQMVSETSHGTKRLETDRLLSLCFPNLPRTRQLELIDGLGRLEKIIEQIGGRIKMADRLARQIVIKAMLEVGA